MFYKSKVTLLLTSIILLGCDSVSPDSVKNEAIVSVQSDFSVTTQSEATKKLLDRNKMFEKQIIKVADNVYTAIGYTVSANSMIVGKDGVVIIDPGQIPAASKLVRQEFEKITDKPVRAIIYTHGHSNIRLMLSCLVCLNTMSINNLTDPQWSLYQMLLFLSLTSNPSVSYCLLSYLL